MDSYDAIIYGSDISTLVSALYLAKNKKKVLLVDNKKRVGDYDNHLYLRRFEIEDNIDSLVFDINNKKIGIGKVLNELGIEQDFVSNKEILHVISSSKNIDYTIPVGIENFVKKIESYIPGSTKYLKTFFLLALECDEAMNYIIKNNGNYEYKDMKKRYPNFVKVVGRNVSNVLDYLSIPIDIQEVINIFWIYFNCSETEVSFIDYAIFVYQFISYNNQIPKEGMEVFITKLLKKYLEYKGDYINNVTINKIITLDKEINGVLINDKIYYTKNFITSVNPSYIYNELVDKNDLDRNALKLCNKRLLTGRRFTIYLGLNRSVKELGIDSYKYLINHSLDSDVEYKRMTSINHDTCIVTVPDMLFEREDDGTSSMIFNTSFMGDVFFRSIDQDNYETAKEDIANNLIVAFETKTGIKISDYIEEIKVFTPLDYEIKYGDSTWGGYKLKGADSSIYRYLNRGNEEFIKGLKICGKYGIFGGLDNGLILSGYYEALRVLNGD